MQEYAKITKNTYNKALVTAYRDQRDYYNKIYRFKEAIKAINQA